MAWCSTAVWPLPNVHLVVSVETQMWANIRIPALLETPAAVRGVSCEPLLGPVDLEAWTCRACDRRGWTDDSGWSPEDWQLRAGVERSAYDGRIPCGFCNHGDWQNLWDEPRPLLDWVIIGGESGPGARPMKTAWASDLVEQCQFAGVAVFVKQLGSAWGKQHQEISTFPPELRIREYPAVVS